MKTGGRILVANTLLYIIIFSLLFISLVLFYIDIIAKTSQDGSYKDVENRVQIQLIFLQILARNSPPYRFGGINMNPAYISQTGFLYYHINSSTKICFTPQISFSSSRPLFSSFLHFLSNSSCSAQYLSPISIIAAR